MMKAPQGRLQRPRAVSSCRGLITVGKDSTVTKSTLARPRLTLKQAAAVPSPPPAPKAKPTPAPFDFRHLREQVKQLADHDIPAAIAALPQHPACTELVRLIEAEKTVRHELRRAHAKRTIAPHEAKEGTDGGRSKSDKQRMRRLNTIILPSLQQALLEAREREQAILHQCEAAGAELRAAASPEVAELLDRGRVLRRQNGAAHARVVELERQIARSLGDLEVASWSVQP
jgi:hypothetical protein